MCINGMRSPPPPSQDCIGLDWALNPMSGVLITNTSLDTGAQGRNLCEDRGI